MQSAGLFEFTVHGPRLTLKGAGIPRKKKKKKKRGLGIGLEARLERGTRHLLRLLLRIHGSRLTVEGAGIQPTIKGAGILKREGGNGEGNGGFE